ncbi:D-alanyl-D-alanine carboxypeptidase family protein [Brucellaceae bacterium C25G]
MHLLCVSGKLTQSFKQALRRYKSAMLHASILSVIMLHISPVTVTAMDLPVKAENVILLDDKTGTVLFSRKENQQFTPASLVKLMTAEVVFNALQHKEINLQDTYSVSENAWRTGGAPSRTSTMFAKIKSTLQVQDLLQGMIVQLANDASIIMAEGIAGTEQQFVSRMNTRAKAIGLQDSIFINSTGLPSVGQHVTVSDLMTLARYLYHQYPQFYPYFSQTDFTWNKIFQRNKNPLLYLDIGVDGMAIGGTKENGFALVVSAEQNGRRLFLSLAGSNNQKEILDDAHQLITWGMNEFDEIRLFDRDDVVGEASVFNGSQSTVELIVKDNVDLLMHKNGQTQLHADISYRGPLSAPVEADQQIGSLKVKSGNEIVKEFPVYTKNAVTHGNLRERSIGALIELSTGWIRKLL